MSEENRAKAHTKKTRGLVFPSSVTVSCRLDYQVSKELENFAKKHKMTLSELTRMVLTDYSFRMVTSEGWKRQQDQLILFAENTYDKVLALEEKVKVLENKLIELEQKD